jgi:polysaccharide export outer membrane protein
MRASMGLAAASVFAATGCLHLPAAPTTPTDDADFSPPQLVDQPGLDDDPPTGLMLQPGDVVAIRTFSGTNQEYTGLVVDDRGRSRP